MSPSEFNILPYETIVDYVNVKVVMYNPRISFETNATNSQFATLNQNIFTYIGIGLNLKIIDVTKAMLLYQK